MNAPTIPNAEPASVLPSGGAPTVFLVQANALRGDFSLIFASGAACTVRTEVTLTPDAAERLARTILADLDGFAERCGKVAAAMAGGAA